MKKLMVILILMCCWGILAAQGQPDGAHVRGTAQAEYQYLCEDSTLTLTADNAIAYHWSTGHNTRSITVSTAGWYTVTVTYDDTISLVDTFIVKLVKVDPISEIHIPDMCAGESYPITVGLSTNNNISFVTHETILSHNDTVFLPDGVSCDPYGCSYRSMLSFSGYDDTAHVNSADDIRFVRLNLEHSFAGDLYINLTCPNGQKADILKWGYHSISSIQSDCAFNIPYDSRGWEPDTGDYYNASQATDFGTGNKNRDETYPCDPNLPDNAYGTGWNYCWSNNTTEGYTYAPGLGSLIYREVNAHTNYDAEPSYMGWPIYGNVYPQSFDSSDVAAGTQFYHPDQSFEHLIGCPLNGDWFIEVIDGNIVDNGYLFGWELALASDIITQEFANVTLTTVEGSWVTTVNDSTFIISPPVNLPHDTVLPYIFHCYSSFGCGYDTMVYITFFANEMVVTDTVICEEEFEWHGRTYTQSGTYYDTLGYTIHGCDSIAMLNLSILDRPVVTFLGVGPLCEGSSRTISVDSVVSCVWSTGETSNSITIIDSGFYSVHITNEYGCSADDSVYISMVYPQVLYVDTVVCDSLIWKGVTYDESGEYTFSFVGENGCDSTVVLNVIIPENPIVAVYLSDMVVGDTQMVTFGMTEVDNLQYINPQTTLSQSDTVFLPDGQSCDPYGCSYQAMLTFADFEDTATIRSPEDIRYVRLNMEHSYIQDLYINFVCPNGQHATILKKSSDYSTSPCLDSIPSSERGWQGGASNVGTAFLGWAYDGNDFNDRCDRSRPQNRPGVGWNYCWSNNTTEGFEYSTGLGGLIYRSVNAHRRSVFGSQDWVIDSSNVTEGTQFYHPDVPFDSLVGCPLNGVWMIEVMDGIVNDNGYIFTWEISLADRVIANHYASVDYSNCEGLWISRLSDTSFVILPPDTLPHDTLVAYTFTVSDENGCSFDTTVYIHVYAHQYTDLYDTVLVTELPYTWNDSVFTSPGSKTFILPTIHGSDSIVTMHLSVIYSIDSTICSNQLPLEWGGMTFYSADTQTVSYPVDGADSLIILSVFVNMTTSDTLEIVWLENDLPYELNDSLYYESGTYEQHLTNAAGCDSTLTLYLTVLYNVTTPVDTAVCDFELPFTWHGLTFDMVGTQYDTLTAYTGVDSVLVLTLTTLASTSGTLADTVLENNRPYELNDSLYDEPGTYVQHLTNAVGCDSMLTLYLTVLYNVSSSVDTAVCDHDLPFTWHGLVFDTVGTQYDTLTASTGVDSVLALTLTTIASTSGTLADTVLENNRPYELNDSLYDDPGTYVQHLTNVAGCDSTLTLYLTVLYNVTTPMDTMVCDHDLPFTWHSLVFDTAGTQYDTLTATTGVDSVLALTLTTIASTSGTLIDTVLENNRPYGLNDSLYYEPGTYVQHLTNVAGCDSTLTLYLTVLYNVNTTIDTVVCDNDLPLTWHGLVFDTVGTQYVTLMASTGVDSVLALTLTTLASTSNTRIDTILENNLPYVLNDSSYYDPGTHEQHLTNAVGCDSTLTLYLTVLYNVTTSIDTAVCDRDLPFTWRGFLFETAGMQYDTLTASTGVDSVLALTLNVLDSTMQILPVTIVENNLPYVLNGFSYDTSGTYVQRLTNVAGCDSILTIELTVFYNVDALADSTICESELPFTWNGVVFEDSGVQYDTLTNSSGADSILMMRLTVMPLPEAHISGTPVICNGDPAILIADSSNTYLWSNGAVTQTISVSTTGLYTVTVTDEHGCSDTASVQVLSTIMDQIADVNLPNLCAGDTLFFTIGHNSSSNIVIGTHESVLSLTDTVFLPDGVYCSPHGCSYRSPLTFTSFSDDAVVNNVNDILYVRLNLEHSYAADLYINLTCPNGQKADILRFNGSSTSTCSSSIPSNSRSWQSGNNAYNWTYFGIAYDHADNSHPCDASTPYNAPGTGWNYCWSNNNTHGYTYAPGAGSLIYRSANAHVQDVGNDTNPVFDSSNVAAGTKFYHPDQSFQSLVGCPLNGSWYIEVMDGFSIDNGYIFGWELALASEITTVERTDVSYVEVEGPWMETLSDTVFLLAPPVSLTHDTTVQYHFQLFDSHGCSYDTLLPITFYMRDTVYVDTTVCESYIWNNITYTESGQYQQHFTNHNGCDSVVVLQLSVFQYPEVSVLGPTQFCTDSFAILSVDSGYAYLWSTGDTTRTISVAETGTYTVTVSEAHGCSSTASHQVEALVNPIISVNNSEICNNSSYIITIGGAADNTVVLNQNPNMFTYEVQGPWLTDSVQNVWMVVPPEDLVRDTVAYYSVLLSDTNGCHYDTTVILSVYHQIHNMLGAVVCDSAIFNGITYTESGQYTHSFVTGHGCDSVITLNLTVHHSTLSYDTLCLIQNQLPYYFAPADITFVTPEDVQFQYSLSTQDGCDSVIWQQVYIYPNVSVAKDTTVCAAAFPLQWCGHTFNAVGTVTDTLPTTHGADSLVTYTVNVDNMAAAIGNVSHVVCYGASTGAAEASVTGGQTPLSYQWKDSAGNAVSATTQLNNAAAGSYSFTVTDLLGCLASDTLIIRNLHDELVPGSITANQSICQGEPLADFQGGAASGGDDGGYQWQLSDDGHSWGDAPGVANMQNYTYPEIPEVSTFRLRRAWITATCGTSYSNTVEVTVWPSYHDTLSAAVCQGGAYWENGFEVDETMTEEPGAYTYEQHLSTGHCDSVIVLQLVVNQHYEKLIEDEICEGGSYNANGFTIPAAETVGADTLQRMLMLTSGQGCDSVVLLQLVVVDTALQIISLTPDFCEGLSAELSVITEMSDYQWNTGESMPQITVTMPGIYSVTATEGDCESTARYTIEPCEFQLILPNAITPSKSDGLNDYFSIPEPVQRSLQDFEISIFNRWGSMVYYSTDKNFRWNGEVEGKIYYNNVYTYIIRCTNAQGKSYFFKGSVTVL